MSIKRLFYSGFVSALLLIAISTGSIQAKQLNYNNARISYHVVRIEKTIRGDEMRLKSSKIRSHFILHYGQRVMISRYNPSLKGYIVKMNNRKSRKSVIDVIKGHRTGWIEVKNHRQKILRKKKSISKRQITKKTRSFNHQKTQKVLVAHYRRSNNTQLLKKSGYFDVRPFGGHFIFNLYAPNDHRAVIPRKLNINQLGWALGNFGQPNPRTYQYEPKLHGWILNSRK